jgi:hypothetical protein
VRAARGDPRLGQEPLGHRGVSDRDELDRDLTIELAIVGGEDRAHPTAPELGD